VPDGEAFVRENRASDHSTGWWAAWLAEQDARGTRGRAGARMHTLTSGARARAHAEEALLRLDPTEINSFPKTLADFVEHWTSDFEESDAREVDPDVSDAGSDEPSDGQDAGRGTTPARTSPMPVLQAPAPSGAAQPTPTPPKRPTSTPPARPALPPPASLLPARPAPPRPASAPLNLVGVSGACMPVRVDT
jgi:hypothetical protein